MINKPNDPKNKDYDPDLDLDDASFEYDGSDSVDSEFEEMVDEDLLENEQDWQEEEPKSKKTMRGKKDFSRGDKKGMSFNTMVIIGAVLLGGGVLVFNVMNQSSKQAENTQGAFQSSMSVSGVIDGALNPADNAPVAPPSSDTASPQPQDSAAAAGGGFLNEGLGDAGAPLQNDAAIPPQPAPVAPADVAPTGEDVVTPLPDEATVIDVASNEVVPQDIQIQPVSPNAEPAPIDPATQIDASPVVVPEATPVVEPVITAAPAPDTSAVNSAALTQLEEKLSTILSRMEKIESDMAEIRSGQSGEIKELEKTVMSLKRDLGEVKQSPAPKKETAPSKPKAVAASKPPVIEPYPKVARPKTSDAVKPQQAQKPAAVAAPSTPEPSRATTGPWELRAAQPGRAWVSKAGERDMQSIEVGQKLSGVGTITAIEYQNGKWVVSGTEGQITQ